MSRVSLPELSLPLAQQLAIFKLSNREELRSKLTKNEQVT